MRELFFNAKAFRGRGVGLWYTAKVVNMEFMFSGAAAFEADLGNSNNEQLVWKTGLVTSMASMFAKTVLFTGAGLGKFDTSKICSTSDLVNCPVYWGSASDGFSDMFNSAVGLVSCSKRKMLDGWKTSTSED